MASGSMASMWQQIETAITKLKSSNEANGSKSAVAGWRLAERMLEQCKELTSRFAGWKQTCDKLLQRQSMKLSYLYLSTAQSKETIGRLRVLNKQLHEALQRYEPPRSSPAPTTASSIGTSAAVNANAKQNVEDEEEFKTVYATAQKAGPDLSSFKSTLEELTNRLQSTQTEVAKLLEQVKRQLGGHGSRVEKMWTEVGELKKATGVWNEQRRKMQEELKEALHSKEKVCMKVTHIDNDTMHGKWVGIGQTLTAKNPACGKTVHVFTEVPMSNEEMKCCRTILVEQGLKNAIRELSIECSYLSEGSGLAGLIAANLGTLKKLSVTRSMLTAAGVIEILEAIRIHGVRLEELVIDENDLHGNDLIYFSKLFLSSEIKKFSVKGNDLSIHSIELFCNATKDHHSLEEIRVGEVAISEQKELEWRTSFIALNFDRIDYPH